MEDCEEHKMLGGRCTVCSAYSCDMIYTRYVNLSSEFVHVKKEDLQKWAKIRNVSGVDYELEMFKAQVEMNKYLGKGK